MMRRNLHTKFDPKVWREPSKTLVEPPWAQTKIRHLQLAEAKDERQWYSSHGLHPTRNTCKPEVDNCFCSTWTFPKIFQQLTTNKSRSRQDEKVEPQSEETMKEGILSVKVRNAADPCKSKGKAKGEKKRRSQDARDETDKAEPPGERTHNRVSCESKSTPKTQNCPEARACCSSHWWNWPPRCGIVSVSQWIN